MLRRIVNSMTRRIPLGDAADELRVTFVPDERPAFLFGLDATHIGRAPVLALDECLGVLEVAVDGLDGRLDAMFL